MTTWYYLSKFMKHKKSKNTFYEYLNSLKSYDAKLNDTGDLSLNCRICLQKALVKICDEEKDLLIDALRIFIDLDVYESYKTILLCKNCYEFLKTAVIFRDLAKKSHNILSCLPKLENIYDNSVHSNENNDYEDGDNEPRDQQSLEHKCSETLASENPDQYNLLKKEKKGKTKCMLKVTCHICNKIVNRSYFKEHVTMHDPDHKKYVCDICGKSFRLRCAYHNHSLRHRTDFPFKCNLCPYKGRYAELLKTHMRTHTGDYRYMCTECPARFLFKSNLNSHMLKHKEPKHKCDGCKRAFHTTLALRRHFEADHLGIKNHVCNICGKAFGYRNAMMKHQRHVHKREKLLFGRIPSYLEAEHKNSSM